MASRTRPTPVGPARTGLSVTGRPPTSRPNWSPVELHSDAPHLRIHAINIFVRDQDRSVRFYVDQLGFGLAFGPLNIAATTGVAPHEQGLAGGLLNTSFQFGGALVLAVVTAVNNANRGIGGSGQALLDGFHPALAVSVIAGVLGVGAVALRVRSRTVEVIETEEVEVVRDAA